MLVTGPRLPRSAVGAFDRVVEVLGCRLRVYAPFCTLQQRKGNSANCGQHCWEAQPELGALQRGPTSRYTAQGNRRTQRYWTPTGKWSRTATFFFASATRPRSLTRQGSDAVGLGLVHNAKWAVYKRQTPGTVGSSKRAPCNEDSNDQLFIGETASPKDGSGNEGHHTTKTSSAKGRPAGSGGEALLRRVWEKQKHLSPAQAADTAYFLALRPNPPEALLQQLTAYILNQNPERSLSTLGLHRLLRVFYLAPGVAERSILDGLCTALHLRVGLMKPAALQLLLADFAAIYTPQFLPLFVSAGRVLRRKHEEDAPPMGSTSLAVGGDDAGDDFPRISGFARPKGGGESLSPLQAAYLLHAYGRTDCRDHALFSMLLGIVDAAVRQLLDGQGQLPEMQGDPTGMQCREGHTDGLGVAETSGLLNGEALVMCVKGLANVCYTPTEAQRRRLAQLLIPYLLSEEGSVLGHAPQSRRLPLLFGAVSGFARLGAGPQELRRLIEEACSQPLTALGPYEPCDLLATALTLQPITALTSQSAAVAVAEIEEQITRGAGPERKQPSRLSVAAPGYLFSGDVRQGGSDDDPWVKVPDDRLKPSSSFWSAAHCYAASVGVGLAALRPSLFSLHPAFRVSILGTLVSLLAVLDPADRPRRLLTMQEGSSEISVLTGAHLLTADLYCTSKATVPRNSTASEAKGHHQVSRPSIMRDTSPTGISFRGSGQAQRAPLNPLLRAALLSVYYRLPCVPLRLLVELLEALQACDFGQRERKEQLCPHSKSQRWYRPLMAVVAREAVRKMQHSTPDAVVRFLVLYYVELNGYGVTLDPLHYGLHRLGRLAPYEVLPHPIALSALLKDAAARAEGRATLKCLTAPGARVVEQFLNTAGNL